MISPSYVDGLELRIKELVQSNKALTIALDKVSDYNLRLEESNKSFVSALQKAEAYNVQLENDRDALAAQSIKMMQSILYCTIYLDDNKLNSIATGSKAHVMLADAITATPLQCLAEIKADAGRDGFVSGYEKCWRESYGTKPNTDSVDEYADSYAAKVRQGGGE